MERVILAKPKNTRKGPPAPYKSKLVPLEDTLDSYSDSDSDCAEQEAPVWVSSENVGLLSSYSDRESAFQR